MALRFSDAPEFAARLSYLMRHGSIKGKELSLAIGRPKGYVSWLMNGAKDVDLEATALIADALAGRGSLTNDATMIAEYLLGIRNRSEDVLRSDDDNQAKGGQLRPFTDLRSLKSVA